MTDMQEQLREALEKIVAWNCITDDIDAPVLIGRAALTQPEPTAQQATDPVAEFAKGMEPLGPEIEAIWDANRDALYEDGSAQQAAGEAVARERDTLIAAGLSEYEAQCALRTGDDGRFCQAYFYSDKQWRFQTGGLDLVDMKGETIRRILTRILYAAPQPEAPAEVQQGVAEAVRSAVRDFWVRDVNKPSWFRDDQNEKLVNRIIAALATPQQGQEVEG